MRPAAPRRFRRSWIEALLSAKALTPRRVLAIRNFAGRPLRSTFTIVGIALAVPMVVLGLFWRDAIDQMIEVQFNLVERGNAVVTFPVRSTAPSSATSRASPASSSPKDCDLSRFACARGIAAI